MKRYAARFLCPALCWVFLFAACSSDESPVQPPDGKHPGELVVQVAFDGTGIPGKELKLLELGLDRTTDRAGYARFSVPPGDYTLRAYGINEGGPPHPYVDFSVTVTEGKSTQLRILDCLVCV